MRTLEEVQATLQIAKVKEEDLQPVTYCLSFGGNVSSGDYCLMELDETLCKHIEAGDKDEHAVLCSEEKTYALKFADTSNLLLFVPGCKTPDQLPDISASAQLMHAQIWGFSNCYWELRQRPRLKKLKKLLMENPYDGPAVGMQEEAPGLKYSMDDLLERIQASREEIEAHLQNVHACEIDSDFWRAHESELSSLGTLVQSQWLSFRHNISALNLMRAAIGSPCKLIKREADIDPTRSFTDTALNRLFFFNRDLCGEKQTTGALLTKHARSSVQNGVKVYNSRRPVSN
uniref:Sister chromatid cohesion protein DCC1 n=1 Tax=Sinocyclocheilus anshuiensis TaxID=1608454 RepID=A0A671PP35_9TELE